MLCYVTFSKKYIYIAKAMSDVYSVDTTKRKKNSKAFIGSHIRFSWHIILAKMFSVSFQHSVRTGGYIIHIQSGLNL